MEYTLKTTYPCEREIQVRVTGDLIRQAKDDYFGDIVSRVALPGYRKGKVPRDILETRFQDDCKEEVVKKLLSIALRRISDAEKLRIIAHPKVENLEFTDSQMKFKIQVELEPEITLGAYKGIKAKRAPFEIKQEEVDEVIGKIRETFANFIPVQREARMEDYLIADYQLEIDGRAKEEHKDEWIFLHEHNSLGDFSQKLLGVKAGEERDFHVALSESHPNQELRGKQAHFSVHIKDVKEKSLPEMNDELAKLAGEYPDLDGLKTAVRDDIKRKKEQDQEAQIERQLLEFLVENTPFETSRGVVERQLEKLIQDAESRLAQRGVPKDKIAGERESFKKEFQPEAEKQVRLAFILDRIAQAEKIRISKEDLASRFEQMAQQYHTPLDKVKEHFQKEENLEGLIEQMINEKVFKLIKDNAVITAD